MNYLKALVLGLACAAAGGLLWSLTCHITGWEIGFVAMAIGWLVGIGVRAANPFPIARDFGILAGTLAAAGILFGKMALLLLVLRTETGELDPLQDRELLVSYLADQVVYDWESSGQSVAWPDGTRPACAYEQAHYPADVWSEAELRWDKLAPQEKAAFALHPESAVEEEFLLSSLAVEIAARRETEGATLDWPEGSGAFCGTHQSDFPTGIWKEALDEWDSMTIPEREALRGKFLNPGPPAWNDLVKAGLFSLPASLAPWDLLWLGIAVTAAYKIGSGLEEGLWPFNRCCGI